MPEIQIRPANQNDLPGLISMEHHYLTNYVWQMERMLEEGRMMVGFHEVRLPRQVRVEYPYSSEKLAEGWMKYLVILEASFQEEAVGYIGLVENQAVNTAWVRDLVVREKHRRQGIASALVLAAQDWAAQKKYRRMILEMQSKNMPAVKLAHKLGFEFCGYNDHYYSNQDIALLFAHLIR